MPECCFRTDIKAVLGLISCRQTRATLCVTPIVLFPLVDAHCDKVVTDDRRQFITRRVHLCLQHLRRSTCSFKIFFKSRQAFARKIKRQILLFLEIPEFPFNTMYDEPRVASTPETSSVHSAVSIQYRLVTDRQTDGQTNIES